MNLLGRPARPAIERFDRKIEVDENNCWLWTGALQPNGYARFKTEGGRSARTVHVHRWSYEHFVEPIPSGLVLDHLCRVRHCANPEHLEPVTCGENIRRGETGKRNREKTHCPAGHSFADRGTRGKDGKRYCKECKREQMARRRAAL